MSKVIQINTVDDNAQVYINGVLVSGSGGGTIPPVVIPPPVQPPAVPANLQQVPYPYGSQLLRDKTIGDVPSGYWFQVPAGLPNHKAVIKNFGFPGECFRDRRIDVNGVVRSDWWVNPLGTRTEDDFSVGQAISGTINIKSGDIVYVWFKHPNGEVFVDRFELLANR